MLLPCWNDIEDQERRIRVFEADLAAHEDHGLELREMWREPERPLRIHFLLDVVDSARAQALFDARSSAEAGRVSGVVDGGCVFLGTGS